jgi:hypothetical protein
MGTKFRAKLHPMSSVIHVFLLFVQSRGNLLYLPPAFVYLFKVVEVSKVRGFHVTPYVTPHTPYSEPR